MLLELIILCASVAWENVGVPSDDASKGTSDIKDEVFRSSYLEQDKLSILVCILNKKIELCSRSSKKMHGKSYFH